MNDIKVFIKVDPSKELYLEDEILEIIENNENMFMGSNESNLHSSQEIAAMFKPISLTELMVGFAEWAKKDELKAYRKQIKPTELEELLEIYLQSKGVAL